MKSKEWKTYRTRFLVKARRLSSNLSFVDSLGRQHSGRKGDYLVESSEGVISIAPRQIFEDIYVAMARDDDRPSDDRPGDVGLGDDRARAQNVVGVSAGHGVAIRKLPQPCRGANTPGPRLGMM
jgi:hypothetical protein